MRLGVDEPFNVKGPTRITEDNEAYLVGETERPYRSTEGRHKLKR